MANFFPTTASLSKWLIDNNSDATEASTRIMNIIQDSKYEQDISESCRRIFAGKDEGASGILRNILSKYDITEAVVASVDEKMKKVYAANELYKNKTVTAATRDKMVKEAQIMRQPGQYEMPLRICPKLPKQSAGQGLISTYNCRHYCLDSIIFDDDPLRVVCAEALWRRHVMDKFSREWQDPKTGKLVGGYINERFYVFPDAGTPANPDVSRDHGNNMALAPHERTRQARPHEYSVERRMQEAREKGSTESIVLSSVPADKRITLTASKDGGDAEVFAVYSKAIDLHNSRVSASDAAIMLKDQFGLSLGAVVKIQSLALKKMASHQADVYVTAQVDSPKRYKVVVNHGEGKSIFSVVDSMAPEGEQPKVIKDFVNDRVSADTMANNLNAETPMAATVPVIAEDEMSDDLHDSALETGLSDSHPNKKKECPNCKAGQPCNNCQKK
jgi:hypothetical protein